MANSLEYGSVMFVIAVVAVGTMVAFGPDGALPPASVILEGVTAAILLLVGGLYLIVAAGSLVFNYCEARKRARRLASVCKATSGGSDAIQG
jgi:hypothetical protein